MKAITLFFAAFALLFTTVACQSKIREAARNVQYSAYEVVGVQKRDILKKRVDAARDDQKEAGESFQDALEKLQSLYGFSGGDLEKQYNSMKKSYEAAKSDAASVKESIERMDTVANDLFREWEKEIGEMQTASLRSKSRSTLADTRQRYAELRRSLEKSERRMEPVLQKFSDQVVYLKHNLNAKAITSLKGEALNIQGEIERLMKEMNASIESADKFIAQME